MQLISDFNRKPENTQNTSFIKRRMRVQITLSKGQFKNGQGNTVIIEDLGMTAKIDKSGPPEFGKCSVEIYGLSLEVMEQLSTLSMHPLFIRRNFINVFAGDDQNGMTQVFAGTITSATVDMNSAPEIKFKIEARIGFFGSLTAQGPSAISGTQPASTFIENQAKKAGFLFENQGVTTQLKNCVFTGSPVEQMKQAARQIGAELVIDDTKVILIPNGSAVKGTVPVLSAQTGLLGYPTMTQNGIECKAIFNPDFRFAGIVEIKSIVPKVSGQWRIIKLSHSLSANLPSAGNWESSITAYYPQMSGAIGKFV